MPLFSAWSAFDSEVEKATSELNVKEDLAVMREICQRCQRTTNGAKDLLRSIVKQLNNKNPHVAMQALTMLDVGVIYGGLSFRQEIASRDFVSECRTLINNGKTHVKVIKRLKHLLRKWTENEFKSDPSLALIPSLFNSLRSEGHNFQVDEQALEIVAVEEDDDLARAIALSLRDTTGKSSTGKSLYPSADNAPLGSLRQVRALYDFEAAEDNELTFKAGELIHILDDSDTNWWKGTSSRGAGLFPANFVTADLTAEPELDISHSKSRKSVRFHDEVDVQVVDVLSPVEVVEINEKKIDDTLSLIQNADPTQDGDNDAPELVVLEEQCRSMGPLIDQELEKIDRQHIMLAQMNGQLMEAFTMYHTLMQQMPSYPATATTIPPYQSFDGQLSAAVVSYAQQGFSQFPVQPAYVSTGFALQPGMSQPYQPIVASSESPQHRFNPTIIDASVVAPGNIL